MCNAYKILGPESLCLQSQMIANAAGLEPYEIVSVYAGFNSQECISYVDEEAKYRFARQWAAHAIIHLEMLVHGIVDFPVVDKENPSVVLAPMVANGIGRFVAGIHGKRYDKGEATNEKLIREITYAAEQYTRLA